MVPVEPLPKGKLPISLTERCRKDDIYCKVDYRRNETILFYQEVTKYWIEEYKIDGWRLDVADEISTTPNDDKRNAY